MAESFDALYAVAIPEEPMHIARWNYRKEQLACLCGVRLNPDQVSTPRKILGGEKCFECMSTVSLRFPLERLRRWRK